MGAQKIHSLRATRGSVHLAKTDSYPFEPLEQQAMLFRYTDEKCTK